MDHPRIWFAARQDAQHNIPPPDARTLSHFERLIQTEVNAQIHDIYGQCAHRAKPLESQLLKARNKVEQVLRPEWERIVELTGRFNPLVHVSRTMHHIMLALLTVGEAAFNLIAFDIFGEPGPYTLLMALAISVAVPLCAWFIGVRLRQWCMPHWKTGLKIAAVGVALLGVLVGVNQLRVSYLGERAADFVANHPELNWIFLAVNLAVLVAAALVTYLATDPQPGFVEAKENLERGIEEIHSLIGQIKQLGTEAQRRIKVAEEAGRQAMAYYRMINSRYRQAPTPNYFSDPSDPNFSPGFINPAADAPALLKTEVL